MYEQSLIGPLLSRDGGFLVKQCGVEPLEAVGIGMTDALKDTYQSQ
jgi:hypothetical protein